MGMEALPPMFDLTDTVAIAIITVLVSLVGALFLLVANLFVRMGKIEGDLRSQRDYSNRLWAYCRYLLDLYYQHRKPGAPEPGPLPEVE